MEEVDGQHAGGLSAQELSPGGVGMADRCRWDPVMLQDPPDRRGADPVAEFEQLALDPLVSPVRVVRCHLHDQRGESAADRWASASVRIGPFLVDETAMPAQDRVRGDQAMATQRSWQPPDERSEDGPVCPVQVGSWGRAADTATSCRKTSSSTSLMVDVRPSSMSSPSTCWKIRYNSVRHEARLCRTEVRDRAPRGAVIRVRV